MQRMEDSAVYRLGYRWTVPGPIDVVYHYVSDSRTFKNWFYVFKEVFPDDPGGPIRVGTHTRMRVKALLPYTLDWDVTVSRHEPPHLLETDVRLSLSGRFGLHGYVRYRFEEQPDGVVAVINEQELAADRPLPRLLHRLAQAAFTFNHEWAFGRAEAPLRRIVRAHVEESSRPMTA
jgi:hypothetical protein